MSGLDVRRNHVREFMDLSRYSRAGAWSIVGCYLFLIVVAVGLGHYSLTLQFGWGKVLAILALVVFIGTRLRGINNIVHECTHNSFADFREDNVLIGKFCSAVLTGCFKKYKEDHLSHHAHLGDYDHDQEMEPIENLGLHDELTPRTVLRHIITPLLGRHLQAYSGKNLSGDDGAFFFGLKIAILVGIAGFTLAFPLTSFWFVLLPLFYVFPTLNFWTDCLDHAGLVGETDELRASRNVLAPKFLRAVFFPRNDSYHLIHHLFPNVPARHFDKVHARLCEDTEYGQEPLAVVPLGAGALKTIRAIPSKLVPRRHNAS